MRTPKPALPSRPLFKAATKKPPAKIPAPQRKVKAKAPAASKGKAVQREARYPDGTEFRKGKVRGEALTVRLQPDMLRRLDKLVAREKITRPEAVRVTLAESLPR